MDNPKDQSFQTGEAKGQLEEKSNQVMETVSNAAQSAVESVQQAGQQVQATAQGAVDSVKNATGMNK